KVHVENRKVFRRTGDENDIVKYEDRDWFRGHEVRRLFGRCANFNGESIEFGQVQYINPDRSWQYVKPDQTCATSSHIRLRFTPPKGMIYGPIPLTPRDEAIGVTPVYKGSVWHVFDDKMPGKKKKNGKAGVEETWPRPTLPPSLYANMNDPPAAPWLN